MKNAVSVYRFLTENNHGHIARALAVGTLLSVSSTAYGIVGGGEMGFDPTEVWYFWGDPVEFTATRTDGSVGNVYAGYGTVTCDSFPFSGNNPVSWADGEMGEKLLSPTTTQQTWMQGSSTCTITLDPAYSQGTLRSGDETLTIKGTYVDFDPTEYSVVEGTTAVDLVLVRQGNTGTLIVQIGCSDYDFSEADISHSPWADMLFQFQEGETQITAHMIMPETFDDEVDDGDDQLFCKFKLCPPGACEQYFRSKATVTFTEDDGTPTDGNGDGTPDSEQPNVESVKSQAGSWVTVEAPEGADITNLQSQAAPGDVPEGVSLPLGVFAIDIEGVTPGGTATITLTVDYNPAINAFMKKGNDGQWYNIATNIQHNGTESTTITIVITDGGNFDTGPAGDGNINDPGGPAEVDGNDAPTGRPTLDMGGFRLDADAESVRQKLCDELLSNGNMRPYDLMDCGD